MPNPTKSPDGVYYFRMRVPKDLTEKVGKDIYSISLRTKDPRHAKTLFTEMLAAKEREHAALRAGPQAVPHKELVALAGQVYREFTERFANDAHEEDTWISLEGLLARLTGEDSLAHWFGRVADDLLRKHGWNADANSRMRLVGELHKVYGLVARRLRQQAQGDYSPDPNLARFPVPSTALPTAADDQSTGEPPKALLTDFYDYWKRDHIANGKAERTAFEYETKLKDFIAWLGHGDAGRVTKGDIANYCDHLRHDKGLSAKTVAGKYLVCIKAVLRAGSDRDLISTNPAGTVRYKVHKRVLARSPGYSDAEAKAILAAADKIFETPDRRSAVNKIAIRWVPWLCNYSGARVGEIVQLRKEDIGEEHGVPLMTITPEAGSVKTGEYRKVPIHPHLVEMGFLDFVRSARPGPLFYSPSSARKNADVKALTGQAAAALGRWVKTVEGIEHDALQPNHAWRHRFKTVGRDVGIDPHYLDALQGHSNGSASAEYGENTVRALRREIEKIPKLVVVKPRGAA